jgi:SanA protein
MKKKLKKITWYFVIVVITTIAGVWIADYRIENTTNESVYNNANKIPHNKVGLLLGTSKYLGSGQPNQYFKNRIQATVELYMAHKIDFIVISGDNSKKYYNEPLDMKNELMKFGIPDSLIFLDYAGFRTYDSVIRLNKIFGQNSFTIISQEFQNRRAIYIAKYLNLQAIGYNAEDIDKYYGFKTQVREKFARVKVFIDLMIDKEPKFLGSKIEIK